MQLPLQPNRRQFIQFSLVGFLNTVLTWIIYWCLILIIPATLAIAFGYLVTSVIGFILNQKKVFKSTSTAKNTYWKYYLLYGATLLLSMGLTYVWTTSFQLSQLTAPIFTVAFTLPFNFLFSKFWVFKRSR